MSRAKWVRAECVMWCTVLVLNCVFVITLTGYMIAVHSPIVLIIAGFAGVVYVTHRTHHAISLTARSWKSIKDD